MIKKGILLFGLTGLIFSGCIKHEVIPAPQPEVDLYAHFVGTINATDFEFTENVLGYANTSEKTKVIVPPPSFSEAVYFSQMASAEVAPSIKIGLGSVLWDAAQESDPTLSLFNNFFQVNDNPNYSDNGTAGFEVTYRDQTNRVWKSSQMSVNQQNVQFTGVRQESDATGDYSLFICNFDCYVYSLHPDSLLLVPPVAHLDSIKIENATYQGWFKR